MAYSRTQGGLLVPEGAHEQAVRDALRRLDEDLRLVPVDSDHFGQRVYKVMRYVGSDRPAQSVLFWGDEFGNPYPLSMNIVDAVQRLDRNTRGGPTDPDEHNARLVAQRHREAEQELEAVADEFRDRVDDKKRSPLPRSRSLYAARNRVRAKSPGNKLNP